MARSSWTSLTGSSLHRTVNRLETLERGEWAAPSLCEGWSVRDVAAHLVWRLDPSTVSLVGRGVGMLLSGRPKVTEALVQRDARLPDEALIARLREHAIAFMTGDTRDNAFDLAEVVVHGLDMQLGIRFSPSSTHEAVLARGAALPGHVRRELRSRTLVAEDAGWRIGDGAPLATTADDIVRFAYGRQDAPV